MNFNTFNTILTSATLMTNATAYAVVNATRENQQEEYQKEKTNKQGNFIGFLKQTKPVRLLSKIFTKKEKASQNESEIEL